MSSNHRQLNFVTSNISADFLSSPGVPTWEERKTRYVQTLQRAQPDVISLQEVTPRQFEFLQPYLPEFTALTVPVINPTEELQTAWYAKYAKFGLPQVPSPYEIVLFYHAEKFELVATDYWWLSPTPERPSIGFGNVAPRAVLWAHLRLCGSGQELLIFTTHLDHRCLSAMLALCRERFLSMTGRALNRIFMGDLNFNPNTENYRLLLDDGWQDACIANVGSNSTTFLYDLPHIPGGRIDHILYRGRGLTPQTWARLRPTDAEARISDHDPVFVRFQLS